jgi:hypothetical protein
LQTRSGVPLDLKKINELSAKTTEPLPSGSRRSAPFAGPRRSGRLARCDEPAVAARIYRPSVAHHRHCNKPWAKMWRGAVNKNRPSIRPRSTTLQQNRGGIAVLWGNLAEDGCVVKRQRRSPPEMLCAQRARACL